MNNYELYHHGVLGMKWGVRRYQNKDGSLTSAGQKRAKRIEKQRTAVKNYSNASKKAEYLNNKSDELYIEARKQRIGLGKNWFSRAYAAIKNDTVASKKYNKTYDKASDLSDRATDANYRAQLLYLQTGRNKIERYINTLKYNDKFKNS